MAETCGSANNNAVCSSWNKHTVYFDCIFHNFWEHHPYGLIMSENADRCVEEVGKDKKERDAG